MNGSFIALLVAVNAAAPALAQTPAAAPAAAVPLIERTKLFGNPTKTAGRISPDGRWLSWIAPRDGVLNVWVAPIADPAQAKPLTREARRPIRSAFWSPDSKTVLFVNDQGGDENFLLYGVDVASGAQKTHTPFEKTRVRLMTISKQVKDRILGVLVQQNDGYATEPVSFTADVKTLYWTDSRGRDTAVLLAQDVASGQTSVVAQDARADIDGGLFDPKTGRAQAYSVDHLKHDDVALDPALQAHLDRKARRGVCAGAAGRHRREVVRVHVHDCDDLPVQVMTLGLLPGHV